MVRFSIPIGNTQHSVWVIIGTMTLTVVGTIYIMYYICASNRKNLQSLVQGSKRHRLRLERQVPKPRARLESKQNVFMNRLKCILADSISTDDSQQATSHAALRKKIRWIHHIIPSTLESQNQNGSSQCNRFYCFTHDCVFNVWKQRFCSSQL